ncbi:MAG: hypothetical protein RI914_1876 [Pseudomonadota bacterium]|jgi:hypothetical protein
MNLIWPHPLTLSPIGLGVGRAVLLAALWLSATGLAQTPAEIYRCGNAYTNQPVAGADCARMGATPVTVIEGTRVHATPGAPVSPATTGAVSNPRAAAVSDVAPNTKVDAQAQRERDQQARQILEAELAKAIAAQAEIARLWNNGEPHKQGDEFKNPARYQERVAQMRMALMRSESDIAGLRREIARLGAAAVKP